MTISTARFLAALYPDIPDGRFLELRMLPGGHQEYHTKSEDAAASASRWARESNVCFGVALRSAKKGDAEHAADLPGLWADIDVTKDLEGNWDEAGKRISDVALPPTIWVRSGNGYHCYWLFTEPLAVTDKNRGDTALLLKGLTAALKGDRSCCDLARVMRLPGTMNYKDEQGRGVSAAQCPEPKPVELVKCALDCRYAVSDFHPFLERQIGPARPSGKHPTKANVAPGELPPRFVAQIRADEELESAWTGRRTPPRDTSRSGYDSMMACMLVRRGYEDEEIAAVLFHYEHGKGGTASPGYLDTTIRSARQFAGDAPGPEFPGKSKPANARGASDYAIQGGRFGYYAPDGRGKEAKLVFRPLSNFTARVVEELERDDGVDVERYFVVEGRMEDGTTLPKREVPAEKFTSMNWITPLWGIRPSITSGHSNKDRLRESIQAHSQDVAFRRTYTHTGWRLIDGKWVFLHGGGVIGADVGVDVAVSLNGPMRRYVLPAKVGNARQAVQASLALAQIAPLSISAPLLSAVYLAPLCEVLTPDFALWLHGPSGSMKSSLAALALGHFGDFCSRVDLPGTWESTGNALEKALFVAKDVLYVVDDYAPLSDSASQAKLDRAVHHVVRAQGNLSGRSRMMADTSLRPDYQPRGLVLSTGEDVPPGESIAARLLTLEIERGDIAIARLTEAQCASELLRHAMSAYVSWNASQMGHLGSQLREEWMQAREAASGECSHARIPEVVAHLTVSINHLCRFAVEVQALTQPEADQLRATSGEGLLLAAQDHAARITSRNPARVFLDVMSSLIAQGSVTILGKRDSSPGGPDMIGWHDESFFYLIPPEARRRVSRFQHESGNRFAPTANALYKALVRCGAMVPAERGSLHQLKVAGRNHKVMKMHRASLEGAQ